MNEKKRYYLIKKLSVLFLFAICFLLVNNTNLASAVNFPNSISSFEVERTDGGFYTLVDMETKKEIDQTARGVFKGDEIILADNSRYEVVKIEGDTVYCKYKGKENISWSPKDRAVFSESSQIAERPNNKIAFYTTHTDESYVPTSGTDSEPGQGDILQVGKAIANNLEKQGVEALISYNKHDPHDANAYQRSRRTAVQLLKQGPAAIIDVHRDGVPNPQFYAKKIDGQNVTQIRLVVGRQNQNMNTNLEFAKKIKAFYDQKKPGLIKGIFLAKGNYNQDLAPRSVLIEVGTHTNSLTAANNGAIIFSSLLPEFLGLETKGARNITGGTKSSLIWILLILVVGVIGFLLISTGSIQGSIDKVKGLGKEFSSYLGNFKGKRKN